MFFLQKKGTKKRVEFSGASEVQNDEVLSSVSAVLWDYNYEVAIELIFYTKEQTMEQTVNGTLL